jgi:hypothetical protein
MMSIWPMALHGISKFHLSVVVRAKENGMRRKTGNEPVEVVP